MTKPRSFEKLSEILRQVFLYIWIVTHVYCQYFFFLFKIIDNWKAYFIYYKLQTNQRKKRVLPLTLPFPLVTEDQLLLPTPSAYPYTPPSQKLNKIKCQIVLVFKTFSTCCHFLLHTFFFIVYWNFFFCF